VITLGQKVWNSQLRLSHITVSTNTKNTCTSQWQHFSDWILCYLLFRQHSHGPNSRNSVQLNLQKS